MVPYEEINPYWDSLAELGFWDGYNLIIRGDMNITLNLRGIWGENARRDPVGD